MDFSSYIDFRIDLNVDREIRILQITDTQPVDPSQQRFDGRLDYFAFNTPFTNEMKYKGEFYYLKRAIEETKPDLIIVTGDNVYGEFDDNGENLKEMIRFFDSYKIPWAPVFGNHDNECKLGVTWQCEQFIKSKYCLFKRNDITGNGNYTVGIFNKGKLVRVMFMMDTNGTWFGKVYEYTPNYPPYNQNEKIERMSGIYPDQIDYVYNTAKEIDRINGSPVKKSFCCHICPNFTYKYAYLKGYQSTDKWGNKEKFDLGGTKLIDNKDFGCKGEMINGFESYHLYDVTKEVNFDTYFVGHDHNNTFSIDCDGIRVSYGIKSSTFDYYNRVGCLVFTLNQDDTYGIEHIFYDIIK